MRRAILRLPRPLSRRTLTTSRPHASQSPFKNGPAPPRLPKEEQELFERLQRQSTGAFSTPREEAASEALEQSPSSTPSLRMQINQSPDSQSPSPSSVTPSTPTSSSRPQINQSSDSAPEIRFENGKEIRQGEDLHPNMRRGAPPEFEGDVNPKTGEVGGPKNEPLRWGVGGDWSYNGRVTDF